MSSEMFQLGLKILPFTSRVRQQRSFQMGFTEPKKKNIPQLLLSIKQHCFFLQAMCELLEFSIHNLVHDDVRDDGIRHGDLNTAMRACSTLSLESENTKSLRRHSLTLLLVLIHFQAHGPQKECLWRLISKQREPFTEYSTYPHGTRD